MDGRVNIPVRGRPGAGYTTASYGPRGGGAGGQRSPGQPSPAGKPPPGEQQPSAVEVEDRLRTGADVQEQVAAQAAAEQAEPTAAPETDLQAEMENWRDQSLRLQAEMDNYRKRQRHRAQDEIGIQHRRLLGEFLRVVDDLERALSTPGDGEAGLREGIQLTRRTALQLMEREGVERIEAQGQAFDPALHEAVATVRRVGPEPAPNTVVQVIEPGYRLNDQLLRPAKVIVAV